MVCQNVAIIGVGLIGGSIGLALRQRGLAQRIVGIVRRRESVDDLLKRGVVTDATTDLSSGVAAAEFIVVCTPVDSISRYVLESARYCPEYAVITDAGSTKARIVQEVESGWTQHRIGTQGDFSSASATCRFVGSHPLAGSEKSGYQYAHPQLLAGRWVVVTPTARSDAQATERVVAFWQALGARVQLMAPEDHDRALALTSHLPHLVASALAGILPPKWADLAASGFRDTTRIAAGPPEIWTPIFLHNRSALLEALGQFEQQLHRFRQALGTENAEMLSALLTQGKSCRDSLA